MQHKQILSTRKYITSKSKKSVTSSQNHQFEKCSLFPLLQILAFDYKQWVEGGGGCLLQHHVSIQQMKLSSQGLNNNALHRSMNPDRVYVLWVSGFAFLLSFLQSHHELLDLFPFGSDFLFGEPARQGLQGNAKVLNGILEKRVIHYQLGRVIYDKLMEEVSVSITKQEWGTQCA